MITDIVSKTNKPPIIARTISCLTIIAIAANEPPNECEESLNLNSLFYSVDVLGRKLDKSYLPNLSIEFYDDGSYKKVLRLIN